MSRLVRGVRVGHATDAEARTGCTVLLGPFRAAVHIAGTATGSRELDTLSARHLTPRADAILLTGGSAFGLAAADGVMQYLEAAGQGFETSAGRVPIVPAAVIFDLAVGSAGRRPDARMGRDACAQAAAALPAEGAVGAGAGATVGKLLGPAAADRGGFGCHTVRCGEHDISVFVVVNAFGDVRDARGRIIAGARTPAGAFADTAALLRAGAPAADAPPPRAGTNTTLAAVVTDAPLDAVALESLAVAATAAFARRIDPVHTPFDGDIVFAASTAGDVAPVPPVLLLALGACAAAALEHAIERAVLPSRTPPAAAR